MTASSNDIRSRLRTSSEVRDRQLQTPEVREEWERTAVARVLALLLVRYRAAHSLSQSALASELGMKQPAIARMERGDRPVTVETLFRVLDGLGIPFTLAYSPRETTNGSPSELEEAHCERIELPGGGRLEIVAG